MKVTFLGHAAVLVEDVNFKALIDPFLTGNPSYKEDPYHTEGITHILVTHGHGDHIGDTIAIAKKTNAIIISNAELASIFWNKDKSLNLHPMHIGGGYAFPFGKVKMTPAVHGSAYHDGDKSYDGGSPGGFLLKINGKKLYHSGGTGLTMDIDDAVRAVDFIKPKIVVPMHYNTFPLIQADPNIFKEKLPDYQVKILQSGESITI